MQVLSDGGFVRSGLFARAVERGGYRDDSDGVKAALLASSGHEEVI